MDKYKNLLLSTSLIVNFPRFSPVDSPIQSYHTKNIESTSKDYEPTYGLPLLVSPHVVSRYEQAIEAAFRILNSGGTAFDALVWSDSGRKCACSRLCLFLRVYSALWSTMPESNRMTFLDGGYSSVLAPDREYNPSNPILGKIVTVPGIVAGLEPARWKTTGGF